MKKLYLSTLVVIALSSSFAASAKSDWSIGLMKGELRPSVENSYSPSELDSLGLTLGYNWSQYISIEARMNKGTDSKSVLVPIFNTNYEISEDIKWQGSILMKASYPVYGDLSVYGIAGYAKTKFDRDTVKGVFDENRELVGITPYNFIRTEEGATYGFGIDYKANNKVNLFIEHQVFNSNKNDGWDSINFGIRYNF